MVEAAGAVRLKLSWKKKLAFAAVVFAIFALGAEALARVGSYLYFDRNPYYLLYGLNTWTEEEGHTEELDGYYKFPPNAIIEHNTPEPTHINRFGFRGADFEAEKPAGTFRVICMGASSTFGYLNRDDETYPFQLQGLLRDELDEPKVEVINAGIPHFTTDNILAALRHEIAAYDPDLVTIYTGCADTVRPLSESAIQTICRLLDQYSAGWAALRKGVNAALGPVLVGRWSPYVAQMDREALERQVELHIGRTRDNLTEILRVASENEIQVVFIRQPITNWYDLYDRGLVDENTKRPGYDEEYQALQRGLEENGHLLGFEVPLYVHHHMNDMIEALAEENGLLFVDNAALVSEHPEGLGSRVHLKHEANTRLAVALREALLPIVVGDARSGG